VIACAVSMVDAAAMRSNSNGEDFIVCICSFVRKDWRLFVDDGCIF